MRDWRKVTILPSETIKAAIRVIDEGALQIAFVVDEQGQLQGTVTDGDIRRAILKGSSLEDEVALIMNSRPITAKEGDRKDDHYRYLEKTGFHCIPVVDKNNHILKLIVAEDLFLKKTYQNPVILMAGGLGMRLRPLTDKCPKPLLKVGDKPLLDTILTNLAEQGFVNFYLSVNYKSEMLKDYFGDGKDWGVNIQYLEESSPLGTAGSLRLLQSSGDLPMIVVNGDVLTKVNYLQLLDFHHRHAFAATMCVKQYEHQIPYGVIEVDSARLVDVKEKPVFSYFINAGIYVVNPDLVSHIPDNKRFDMTDLFSMINEQSMEAGVFPIREYWIDIGRTEEYRQANFDYYREFE
ncbi:MAG: nucleotidyltransferase family protein [Gammaproteobacteria bacterium]|nr:nucleotidyltransferase family protein [Gammaproteobacteria bacterium]